MSGEFRWCGSGHLHSILEEGNLEVGQHRVSIALHGLYSAIAPVEKNCAWVEACDSRPAHAAIGLLENWRAIEAAFNELRALRKEYADLAEEVLDNKYKRSK